MEAQRRGGRPYYSSGRGPSGPPYHYHPRPPAKSSARFEPVDREKTCPLLLRVFTKVGGHHSDLEFSVRGKEPKDEVQIYTWLDATLRELTDLVKEVAPEARSRDASLSFAFVYPTKTGLFVVREGDGAATQRRGLPVREAKDAEKRWRCRCRAAQGMEMHSGATDGKRATMLFGWEELSLIQMQEDQMMVAKQWVTLTLRLEITWTWQFLCKKLDLPVLSCLC